ncbi:MAG: hypothetical protein JSS90_07180 [Bacteroidetes bacterium]|jgi:hypothetical protein|nr:hypothetical protein [Bacteroidota bacterium]
MNKILAVFVVGIFVSIASYNYKCEWSNVALADTTDINPNKSSELSLLMRKMYDHAAEARKAIASDKTVSYPKTFLNINTAVPTDDHTKNEYFETFADLYLQSLDTYEKSGAENRVKSYNNIVNACLACHSSHCPGPVPKIKKLIITDK